MDGKGVSGLELGVSVRPEDADWVVANYFKEAHVRTDADGIAIVPWALLAKNFNTLIWSFLVPTGSSMRSI